MASTKAVLRSFLYLNTLLVADYLSAVDGGLSGDQTLVERAGQTKGIKGGLNIHGAGAGGEKSSDTMRETTTISATTDVARFQRLYQSLKDSGELEYYQKFDPTSWPTVERNNVVECDVEIALPELRSFASTAGAIGSLAGLVSSVTGKEMLDDDAKNAIAGIQAVSSYASGKGLPLRMTLLGSRRYTLLAYLEERCLRVPEDRLTGQVTVVAKVQRVLGSAERIQLVDLTAIAEPLNRQQRRRSEKTAIPPILSDVVKAPAAIVVPVAIYI